MPELEQIRRYSELNFYRYHRSKTTSRHSGRAAEGGLMAILYGGSIGITLVVTVIIAISLGGWIGGSRSLAAASSLKGLTAEENATDAINRRVTGTHLPLPLPLMTDAAVTTQNASSSTPETVLKRMPDFIDPTPDISKEVQLTFDLLEEGYGKVILTNSRRDIILMFGSEDSEKSDLVQFLSRNNSGLISVETAPDSEKYFIQKSDMNSDSDIEMQYYPEMYIDQINDLTFYECPSFADVPSLSTEFPAAYFTKAVTDHARSVKVLLAITYSAVTPGNHPRKVLTPFILRVAGMVQNLGKFGNSVALIVTDVENEYSRKTKDYISDDIVIRNIGDFILKEVESYLDQHGSDPMSLSDEDQNVLKNARLLLEAITTVDGTGAYNKIGLFRRPDEPGPIDKSEMLQQGKTHMLKLIKENLVYQPKATLDFRYAVSKNTEDSVTDLVRYINAKANAGFSVLSSDLSEELQNKITDNNDWEILRGQLKSQLNSVHSLIAKLNATKDAQQYFKIFQSEIAQFGGIESAEVEKFKNYGNYISFAQEFSGNLRLFTVENPLQGFQERLEQAGNWLDLLFAIHSSLSTYKYQNNSSLYNVANLTNWGIPKNDQGLVVTEDNFIEFFNLTGFNTSVLNVPQNLTADMLADLNSVIRNTLQTSDPVVEIENGTLTVRGKYVSFSKITAKAPGDLKLVRIYAHHTIFIDDNMELPGISLSIFAPNWELIGLQNITLDGVDNHINLGKADGVPVGQDGRPGVTGGQGGTGGSFLGVGQTFINVKNLRISARGGKGGKGQDGGDGGEGVSGTEAPFPPKEPMVIKIQPGGRYGVPSYPVGVMGIDWLKSNVEEIPGWESVVRRNFIVYGSRGQRGKRGGDGGTGGQGGFGGDVRIVGLDKPLISDVSVDNRTGDQGNPGIGGQGGQGGRDGPDIKVAWVETTHGFAGTTREWQLRFRGDPKPMLSSGLAGITGAANNTAVSTDRQIGKFVNPKENWALQANGFEQFLRRNFGDPVSKYNLLKAIKQTEGNLELNTFYNAVGLLDNFNGLEQQFSELYRTLGPDLEDSYQSLLLRVETYAQATSNEDDMSRRKALAYLYTALRAKVYNFKLDSEKVSIPNLESYIDNKALKNIEGLRSEGRIKAFGRQNQEYVSRFTADITEIQDFNSQVVIPNVQAAKASLATQINLRIGLNDPESERELKQRLVWSSLFQVVENIGQIATFCGSAAEGIVDGTGDSINEIFILDADRSGQIVPGVVPRGLKHALTSISEVIETQINDEVAILKGQIGEISDIIKFAPDRTQDLKIRIEGIRSKLDMDISGSVANYDTLSRLDDLSSQLRNAIRDKQASLAADTTLKSSETVMNRVNSVVQSMEVTAAIGARQFNGDNATIESLANVLVIADSEIQRIRKIEKSVYSTLAAFFTSINGNIADMNRTLGTMDQVGLDVTRWKVESTLVALIESLGALKEEFRVENRYASAIDEVQESLVKLQAIYSRITFVKEQKALVNYVANLESPGSTSISLLTSQYGIYVPQLDKSIKSSLILLEFAPVITAFQQFVFPFAVHYADTYILPPGNDTVTQALTQTRQVLHVLKEYRNTIGNLDTFLEFTDEPFYRWDYLDFDQEIDDLLSGKPVTLQARVRNSDKEALKIKRIEVKLILSDSTRQSEFDSILENYNVELTHDGNSFYGYQGRVYMVNTKRTIIGHSFLRGSNKRPKFSNDAYMKVVNGEVGLSPFTFWTFRIIPLNWKGFQDLEEFTKIGVNLVLAGEGTYLVPRVNGTRIPDLHLDTYYQRVGQKVL